MVWKINWDLQSCCPAFQPLVAILRVVWGNGREWICDVEESGWGVITKVNHWAFTIPYKYQKMTSWTLHIRVYLLQVLNGRIQRIRRAPTVTWGFWCWYCLQWVIPWHLDDLKCWIMFVVLMDPNVSIRSQGYLIAWNETKGKQHMIVFANSIYRQIPLN